MELEQPPVRSLKVYALDPSAGNYIAMSCRKGQMEQDLKPGPVGRKIAVIDYDAVNNAIIRLSTSTILYLAREVSILRSLIRDFTSKWSMQLRAKPLNGLKRPWAQHPLATRRQAAQQ